MVNGRSGRSRFAAGRLGATGGWRLAAWLALEWLRAEPRQLAGTLAFVSPRRLECHFGFGVVALTEDRRSTLPIHPSR